MKYVFADFEMHPIGKEHKEERKVCQNEIIEFGAVMLDEGFEEIAAFKEYVKPEYLKEIYNSISILTGITKGRLAGASKFNDVFERFVSWCNSLDNEFTVYAWSGCDFEQITKEMQLKKTVRTDEVEKVLRNWADFQKDYCELVKAEKLISLEKALNSIGQYYQGDMHDALWDARNTAHLFTVTRNQDEFFGLLASVKTMVNQDRKIGGSTLGDMFDFGSICLA